MAKSESFNFRLFFHKYLNVDLTPVIQKETEDLN